MEPIHFSIIIPTYNRAHRIVETIQSVLDQNYEDFELIIVDDGSTDNTQEIVGSFEDERIRYFKKSNEERAIARNYGIEKANGAYITFLDSDDRLYPHYFEEALKVIKSNNNPEWFHLAYEIKDENGEVLRREIKRQGDINKSLITGNHLSCIGVFVKKDIIQKLQFNTDPDIIGSEDYLLWMELACLYPLRYSNRISAYMIQHSGRSVVNFKKDQLIKRIKKNISYVVRNPSFQHSFSKKEASFKSHRYLYLANHLSRSHAGLSSLKYYFLSISHHPIIAFHRNSFSYLKSLILSQK